MKWNVSGEYITDLARTWFYEERRPYEEVERLLLECMCGTDTPKEVLKGYAYNIITFEYKFEGNTADDTFGLVDEEEKDKERLREEYPFYKYVDELIKTGKAPFEVCEYGFINPKGIYIPIGWGKHAEFACDYVDTNIPIEEVMKSKHRTCLTDYLVYELGWVLIDNPHQGSGIAHYESLNKKQRETLFDYYIHYNKKDKAKALYGEEV